MAMRRYQLVCMVARHTLGGLDEIVRTGLSFPVEYVEAFASCHLASLGITSSLRLEG